MKKVLLSGILLIAGACFCFAGTVNTQQGSSNASINAAYYTITNNSSYDIVAINGNHMHVLPMHGGTDSFQFPVHTFYTYGTGFDFAACPVSMLLTNASNSYDDFYTIIGFFNMKAQEYTTSEHIVHYTKTYPALAMSYKTNYNFGDIAGIFYVDVTIKDK